MAITSVKDPITGKTIEIVEGVVQFVKITDIPKDKYGNDKRVSILIDENGQWISWGAVKSEKNRVPNAVNAKDVDGQWHDIAKGFKIRVPVERNGDFLNPVKSSLVVLETAPVQTTPPEQQTSGNQATGKVYQKKDDTGMYVGHALKGASFLFDRFKGDIFEHGKFVHDITRKVQKEYQSRSGLNDYESGNAAGNAVLLACQYAGGVDKVETYANRLLDKVVPALTAYVRGESVNASVSSSNQSSPTSTTNAMGNKESGSQGDTEGFNDTNDDDSPF